jgi:hypothetical protein
VDLQAARAVKDDLEEIFATRGPDPRRRGFALGLAPSVQTEYELAVRAAEPEDLRAGDLAIIRRLAGNEFGVRYTGAITPLTGAAAALTSRRFGIGSSVAHYRCHAGSLGFFARRAADGTIGFVSNNHVLALRNAGADGDEVLHPAPRDGGVRPADVVAKLVGGYPHIRRGARVDCAFARLLPGIDFDPSTLEPGQQLSRDVIAPELLSDVIKIGRTTGVTHGRISAFEFDSLNVAYSLTDLVPFRGQIEIESLDGTAFSRGGDSGSLAYSRAGNHPVGLLFALSAKGGPSHPGLTYANPIGAVLKALGIKLL